MEGEDEEDLNEYGVEEPELDEDEGEATKRRIDQYNQTGNNNGKLNIKVENFDTHFGAYRKDSILGLNHNMKIEDEDHHQEINPQDNQNGNQQNLPH